MEAGIVGLPAGCGLEHLPALAFSVDGCDDLHQRSAVSDSDYILPELHLKERSIMLEWDL